MTDAAEPIKMETTPAEGKAPSGKTLTKVEPVIQMANAIQERPVNWQWHNRLELGAVNVLGGDPASGKSLLAVAITAAVTAGSRWPDAREADWSPTPRNVILLTSEDDPSRATVPRLRAAGANLERVAILRMVVEDGEQRALCLQRDLRAIEETIIKVGDVAVVVVDPVDSYLGRTDSNQNEEVRAVLEPLVYLAEKHDVCFIVIKHLNKSIGTPSALYRVAGTIAFVALARTVHIVASDPEDKHRRLMLPLKVAHGPRPDALAYHIGRTEDGQPIIMWEDGGVEADADEVLQGKSARAPSQIDRVVEWLRDVLQHQGPQPSKELDARADASGFAKRTVDRGKERLGVMAYQDRTDGKLERWMVRLPDGETKT